MNVNTLYRLFNDTDLSEVIFYIHVNDRIDYNQRKKDVRTYRKFVRSIKQENRKIRKSL